MSKSLLYIPIILDSLDVTQFNKATTFYNLN